MQAYVAPLSEPTGAVSSALRSKEANSRSAWLRTTRSAWLRGQRHGPVGRGLVEFGGVRLVNGERRRLVDGRPQFRVRHPLRRFSALPDLDHVARGRAVGGVRLDGHRRGPRGERLADPGRPRPEREEIDLARLREVDVDVADSVILFQADDEPVAELLDGEPVREQLGLFGYLRFFASATGS